MIATSQMDRIGIKCRHMSSSIASLVIARDCLIDPPNRPLKRSKVNILILIPDNCCETQEARVISAPKSAHFSGGDLISDMRKLTMHFKLIGAKICDFPWIINPICDCARAWIMKYLSSSIDKLDLRSSRCFILHYPYVGPVPGLGIEKIDLICTFPTPTPYFFSAG